MKKRFIIIFVIITSLLFITTLCVSHFVGKKEIANNNTNEQIEQTNEVFANVETTQQENTLTVESVKKQENSKQEETQTNQIKQEKTTQQNAKKGSTSTNSNTKTQENKESNTQTTSKENKKTQEESKENNKPVENKENNEKTNNVVKCEHGNENWYNTKSEAIAVYENKLKYWEDKWANYEIDNDTFYKNKPNGYEVWSCPVCHKWTISIY